MEVEDEYLANLVDATVNGTPLPVFPYERLLSLWDGTSTNIRHVYDALCLFLDRKGIQLQTGRKRTHTYYNRVCNSRYYPIDLTEVITDPRLYTELLDFVANHANDLCLCEVGNSQKEFRLCFDFDNIKPFEASGSNSSWRSVLGVSVLTVVEVLQSWLETVGVRRRVSEHNITFTCDSQSTGLHVVFRDLLVKSDDGESARLLSDRLRGLQGFLGRARPDSVKFLENWKLDMGPTKTGTLRLPFQKKSSAGIGLMYDKFPHWVDSKKCAMINGSVLMTSQARNPVFLNDPSLVQQEDPLEEVGLEPLPPTTVNETRGIANPSFLDDFLKLNSGVCGGSLDHLHAFAYGADFLRDHKTKGCVLSADILREMMAGVSSLSICPTKTNLEEMLVSVMNRHFIFVQNTGLVGYRAMSWDNSAICLDWWTPRTFATNMSNLTYSSSVQITNSKTGKTEHRTVKNSLCKLWSESPLQRRYSSCVFNPYPIGHPSAAQPHQFNTFGGWKWSEEQLVTEGLDRSSEPEFAAANRLQKHIFEIICRGDPEKFQFLMLLICAKIRRPWLKPPCCPVFTGNEGSGKSSPFEFLLLFAGECGAKCMNLEEMLGQFNSRYKDKLIIFLDEASWYGAVKMNTQMKNYISSKTCRTEEKYKSSEVKACYSAVFQVANEHVVVKQGEHCRRYAFFPVRTWSARGNARVHAQYFTDLYKVLDNDCRALKLWFSQFYERNHYPDSLLDSYGEFSYHYFPRACINELERQKCFSHGSVTKFWERVLSRGYVYLPSLDYNMNSMNGADFLFGQAKATASETVYVGEVLPGGRVVEDLILKPPMHRASMEWVMMEKINPIWKPGRMWLETVNMEQVYHTFNEMRSGGSDLSARKGLDDKIDYSSFLFQTSCIFPVVEEEGRSFYHPVKAEWQYRSAARRACTNDRDWNTKKFGEDRGDFVDQEMLMYSLGSFLECKEAFYIFTGVDLTREKIFKKRDEEQRPERYDEKWTNKTLELFAWGDQ